MQHTTLVSAWAVVVVGKRGADRGSCASGGHGPPDPLRSRRPPAAHDTPAASIEPYTWHIWVVVYGYSNEPFWFIVTAGP